MHCDTVVEVVKTHGVGEKLYSQNETDDADKVHLGTAVEMV